MILHFIWSLADFSPFFTTWPHSLKFSNDHLVLTSMSSDVQRILIVFSCFISPRIFFCLLLRLYFVLHYFPKSCLLIPNFCSFYPGLTNTHNVWHFCIRSVKFILFFQDIFICVINFFVILKKIFLPSWLDFSCTFTSVIVITEFIYLQDFLFALWCTFSLRCDHHFCLHCCLDLILA